MKFILLILSHIFTTNSLEPKFCVDCKHFKYNFFSGKQFGKCALFPMIEKKNQYYLVDGQYKHKYTDYYYCSVARIYHHMCGLEGKLFEKK